MYQTYLGNKWIWNIRENCYPPVIWCKLLFCLLSALVFFKLSFSIDDIHISINISTIFLWLSVRILSPFRWNLTANSIMLHTPKTCLNQFTSCYEIDILSKCVMCNCQRIILRYSNTKYASLYMSRSMTKPTIWPVRPAMTQISLGLRQVWSVIAVCMKNVGSLSTQKAHSKDWPDWADVQADLNLSWVHRSLCWFCRAAAHMLIWRSGSKKDIPDLDPDSEYCGATADLADLDDSK